LKVSQKWPLGDLSDGNLKNCFSVICLSYQVHILALPDGAMGFFMGWPRHKAVACPQCPQMAENTLQGKTKKSQYRKFFALRIWISPIVL